MVLGVKRCTDNVMIYYELGRVLLCCERNFRMLKFWLKFLASDNCISKSYYRELVLNCTNWAAYVRNLLCSLGLNYLWENQWLLNTDCSILSIIRQRLLDQTKQELNLLLDASSKCILYKYIVSNIDLQFYLQKNIPAMFRKYITRLRLSSHNIFIETGRYTGNVRNDRKYTVRQKLSTT